MYITFAQIETPATADASTDNTAPTPNPFGGFMPMMLIFVALFYFMMIRPQQRKDKERRKQLENLRAGVKVSFGGGIIGVIDEVKDATFRVKIAENTVIEIARGAVAAILSDPNTPAENKR